MSRRPRRSGAAAAATGTTVRGGRGAQSGCPANGSGIGSWLTFPSLWGGTQRRSALPHERHRIDRALAAPVAVEVHLEMQVLAGRMAARADEADLLAGGGGVDLLLPCGDEVDAVVVGTVRRAEAGADERLDRRHPAGGGNLTDRRALERGQAADGPCRPVGQQVDDLRRDRLVAGVSVRES